MIICIEALNYKCLRYVRQDVGQFHVLVGPNASGKSTFLDVIGFIGDLLFEGPEYAVLERASHRRRVDELTWRGMGNRIELAVEMKIPEELAQRERQQTICRYEVAVGNTEDDPEPRVLAEYLLLMPKRSVPLGTQTRLFPSEPQAPDTILVGTKRQMPGLRAVVKKIEESGNDYFRSETSDWNTQFRFGPTKAALANLPEDEHKFPVASWAKNLLRGGILPLALNSAQMRQPAPRGSGLGLDHDGSNLPSVIRRLQKHPEQFKLWINHVRSALPDLENVRVRERPQDRSVYLTAVFRNNMRVPSWLVSEGTLRLLALTIIAYIQPLDAMYLIEEPENGIHPKALEAVFQSLSSTYGSQVMVATHSPVLLRLARPDQILCFAKTPEGATDIVRGSEHPRLRDWQGEVDLADFFAAGVLG